MNTGKSFYRRRATRNHEQAVRGVCSQQCMLQCLMLHDPQRGPRFRSLPHLSTVLMKEAVHFSALSLFWHDRFSSMSGQCYSSLREVLPLFLVRESIAALFSNCFSPQHSCCPFPLLCVHANSSKWRIPYLRINPWQNCELFSVPLKEARRILDPVPVWIRYTKVCVSGAAQTESLRSAYLTVARSRNFQSYIELQEYTRISRVWQTRKFDHCILVLGFQSKGMKKVLFSWVILDT